MSSKAIETNTLNNVETVDRPLKKAKVGVHDMSIKKSIEPIKIVSVCDLNFEKDITLMDVYTSKDSGYKGVKINSTVGTNRPLLIQFMNEGGKIPMKFGIDQNQHGKTYLSFPIPSEVEYAAMCKFQADALSYAKTNKEKWWTYPVNDNQVEDNFANLVSARKERSDGNGFWPGNMKANIPIDENGDLKGCEIIDENGNEIKVQDVPGRAWDSIIVEMSGIYFQNRFNWGFGPKKLRLLKMAEESYDRYMPEQINYSNVMLHKDM